MDNKIIFIKTAKGEDELSSMSGDMKRVMLLINEKATLGEITRRAPPSLRGDLHEIIQQLIDAELIRDKDINVSAPRIVLPKHTSIIPEQAGSSGELDFTGAPPTPSNSHLVQEVAKQQVRFEAEAKSKQGAKLVASVKAEAEAKFMHEVAIALAKAEAETRAKQEAELAAKVKAEVEARAKAESEARVREEIEAAVRAKQEAETARVAAEIEAARIKSQLEAVAKAKAEAEAEAIRLRAEQEALRLKAEKEEVLARAKAEADERARQEQARIKAQQEAERIRAEQEALDKAKAVEEERVRQAAESARVAAEKEVSLKKAELEAAERLKSEAENKARQLAELAKLAAEKEAVCIKVEQEEFGRLVVFAATDLVSEGIATQRETSAVGVTPPDVQSSPAIFKIDLGSFNSGVDQHSLPLGQIQPVIAVPSECAAPAQQEKKTGERTAPTVEKVSEVQQKSPPVSSHIEQLKNVHVANWHRDKQNERNQEHALAEEQAKAWAEAELRAQLQAKLDAEQTAQQDALAKARSIQKPVVRARRKPLPLAKIALSLVALVLMIVIALPYFWPMREFLPQLENKLSAQLNQPVHIGEMSAASLPPKLELHYVNLGSEQEVKVVTVVINFDLLTLFSEQKSIRNVELKNITLDGQHLDQEVTWLKALGGDNQFPLQRLTIHNLQVIAEGIPLPQLNGSADFTQGAFTRVVLHSEDDKFNVELLPQEKQWKLSFGIKESPLPLLADVMFSDFSATGLIGESEVDFSEIIAHAYGGIVSGTGKLSWRKGWQVQGRFQAKAMELEKLFPQNGITGEVFTEGNFSAQSAKLLHLGDAPRLDVTFEGKKGVISGFDIVETARLSSYAHLPGGRTHYEEFTGTLQLEERNLHFRQVKIISGILNASGAFDIPFNNDLSGSLSSEIKMREGIIPLVLSGTLTEPKLVAR